MDQLSINTIRFLSVDAIQKANSGHPGLPLGAAPMAYVLWTRFLRHNPVNPHWFNRDRFVLSAGHGSMLLYSLLHLTGYDLPLEQIKQFRQWGSITPGHPERGVTPGVETTTGPLGQGFGNGVGMAIAEAYLAARYNRPGFEIINHFTYGLVSDGDLMEGVAAEAASLAGHLKLGKLIYLYDDNRITLAGLDAAHLHRRPRPTVRGVWLAHAIGRRRQRPGGDRPRHPRGAPGNGTSVADPGADAHRLRFAPQAGHLCRARLAAGRGRGEADETESGMARRTAVSLCPRKPSNIFARPSTVAVEAEAEWNAKFAAYEKQYPELARELRQLINGELPQGWDADIPQFPADAKGMATRVASGKVMDAISPKLPGLIGGSADLNPSTLTELKDAGNFENPAMAVGDLQGSAGGGWSYAGRNLQFGVREHGMGAILNGLAAHGGIIPFGATFLTFSDYMRPSIRLAALMGVQVIYVFTHDSIGMGEDGPTHQPVEQIASLRAIPRLIVIRPADANETAVAWRVAIETRDRPVALVLTRQNVPTLDRKHFASAEGLRRGAYVLADAPQGKPQLILIASGSEVGLIVAARETCRNRKSRCASFPCRVGNCSRPNPTNIATRCCRRRSAPGSRSRRA